MNNNFVSLNQQFWSHYTPQTGSSKILVEEPEVPYIIHINAIFALILNQAKKYQSVWLESSHDHESLLNSYVSSSVITRLPRLSISTWLRLCIYSIHQYRQWKHPRDILNFRYDGIKYGDLVYDEYLLKEKVATISKLTWRIFPYLLQCLLRHVRILAILQSTNYRAVLVSHQVGINSGVMLRVALRYGYEGYLRAGQYKSSFQRFISLDEVYNYEYKPFPRDIGRVNKALGDNFSTIYQAIKSRQTQGKGGDDSSTAYSQLSQLYKDRKSFNERYSLDSKKKNVWVMLHSFNDYPHSHFKWMIFQDFYHWFRRTLEYARQDDSVNWIFKQHPSIRFYPTKDVDYDHEFFDLPDHIRYLDENKPLNTLSLTNCADIIITCLGSAGFELPALSGTPSIIASDTFYSGLGITNEPTNENEYFNLLKRFSSIPKLTPSLQKMAQAAYMYIYEFSTVSVSAAPSLTIAEQNDPHLEEWYWNKVMESYIKKSALIYQEISTYISKVANKRFKRLDSIDDFTRFLE